MRDEDLSFYGVLINEITSLLNHKDKLGIANLPSGFGGIASDLLNGVNGAPVNTGLLLLVDELLQECDGKSDEVILHRFELLRSTLLTIYERCKALPRA